MPNWIIKNKGAQVHAPKGMDPAIYAILRERGIAEAAMPDFLSERPRTTYDPMLMPDMKKTVDRLILASQRDEKICIYGDYDADGVTSTALLTPVLKLFCKHVGYYVPSRFVDGYGLNMEAVRILRERGAELIVTVDCGSTSPAEVAYAKELGMDVIVTDHHTPDTARTPDCLFINPKREGSVYPFQELSGCGVVFKLAQALQRKLSEKDPDIFPKSRLSSLTDLVAISSVADVVPLVDENRTLVKYGLEYINMRTRPGLRVLLEHLECADTQIDSDRIAYLLAPNINALGRMDSALSGVELFCGIAADGGPSRSYDVLAEIMLQSNAARKAEQEKTHTICMKAMRSEDCGEYFPIIRAPGAHEGVAGIVAGNLKEQLHRPVCIVTPSDDGMLKGTGRSVPGISLYELLAGKQELFERFGGHDGACGFSMKEENLPELRSSMQQRVKELLEEDPGVLTENIIIEKELAPSEMNVEFAEQLRLLEPYGEGNPRPLFCVMNAKAAGLRHMGAESRHLRFTALAEENSSIGCVLFRRADEYYELLDSGCRIDVAGELGINEFGGSRRLQMIVRDIREHVQ